MTNKAAPATNPATKLPFASDVVKPGPAFLRAVGDHTRRTLLEAVAEQQLPQGASRIAVVDIPRGAMATSLSTASFLAGYYAGAEVRRYASNIKDIDATAKTLLPAEMVAWNPDLIVIADGVIASGGSIIRHLEAVAETHQGAPQVLVVANVLASQGQKALAESAGNYGLHNRFSIVSGLTLPEDQSTWMTFEGGKQVLFVGYNPDQQLDLKIPDFGDYTVPHAPASKL